MKKGYRIGLVFGILFILVALICANNVSACTPPEGSPLVVGRKHVVVGEVQVWNDCENLYVEYIIDPEGDWEIVETHLAIGDTLVDIPQTKKGNPKIGHFPYNDVYNEIPLSEIDAGKDCTVVIAAHAVVGHWVGCEWQEETAWANTEDSFDGSSWALYFHYTLV